MVEERYVSSLICREYGGSWKSVRTLVDTDSYT
ncbi:hypothetical protein SAMN05421724_1659 [Pseudomonas syringae]|nr:hypothetical protein SAMN05421724_1659 [Pseudomonas syringae]